MSHKCDVLNQKLDALLKTLEEESQASAFTQVQILHFSMQVELMLGKSTNCQDLQINQLKMFVSFLFVYLCSH